MELEAASRISSFSIEKLRMWVAQRVTSPAWNHLAQREQPGCLARLVLFLFGVTDMGAFCVSTLNRKLTEQRVLWLSQFLSGPHSSTPT